MIEARALSLRHFAVAALMCAAGPTGAETVDRIAFSWLAMTESCLTYAETGSRESAFGAWHVAAPGGGVCNGDPGCEGDEMTFVGAGEAGLGAVTVTVGAADWAVAGAAAPDRVVADRPTHMSCSSAPGLGHRTSQIGSVHGAWIDAARESGRFVEGGVFAGHLSGPYLGCGYDGRPYQIEFSLHKTGAAVFRLYFPAREGGAEGTGPTCGAVIG